MALSDDHVQTAHFARPLVKLDIRTATGQMGRDRYRPSTSSSGDDVRFFGILFSIEQPKGKFM